MSLFQVIRHVPTSQIEVSVSYLDSTQEVSERKRMVVYILTWHSLIRKQLYQNLSSQTCYGARNLPTPVYPYVRDIQVLCKLLELSFTKTNYCCFSQKVLFDNDKSPSIFLIQWNGTSVLDVKTFVHRAVLSMIRFGRQQFPPEHTFFFSFKFCFFALWMNPSVMYSILKCTFS